MLEASADEDHTRINRRQGGGFERRIAIEPPEDLRADVRGVIRKTIRWPSTSQSLKGVLTAGVGRTYRYLSEKMAKHRQGTRKLPEQVHEMGGEKQKQEKEKRA